MKKLLLLILFFSGITLAQEIEVAAGTDSSEYFVGDYIKYKITISADKNIKHDEPEVVEQVDNLVFIKKHPPVKQETGNKNITVYSYIFSKYDSNEVTIPAITIPFMVEGEDTSRTIQADPVTILVKTLPVDPNSDIKDVKSPVRIPLGAFWFILAAVIFLLIVYGAYYFYYRSKFRNQVQEGSVSYKVVIPPHKEAIKKLTELEEKKLWQNNKVKEYHYEITGILRYYFERRFNFPAMEMPSSEVMDHLKSVKETGKVFDLTCGFFENADMVKYAKFKPMASVNEEMMKQAYEIVNETKPEEKPALEDEDVR